MAVVRRHLRELLAHRHAWWLLVAAALVGGLAAIRVARHGSASATSLASTSPAPAVLKTTVAAQSIGAANVAAPPTPSLSVSSLMPLSVAALVDVRLDSEPTGATVTLVDRGKSSPLGTTPIAVSVDPSHGYDVVFAATGYAPKLAHFDPRATQVLVVPLGGAMTNVAAVAPQPAPAPAPHHTHHAQARVASIQHGSAGDSGVLMISTKPPCAIAIDGAATGLTTPQRSIDLSAGAHRVTLTNAGQHLQQTISVNITANGSTKIVRDLMK